MCHGQLTRPHGIKFSLLAANFHHSRGPTFERNTPYNSLTTREGLLCENVIVLLLPRHALRNCFQDCNPGVAQPCRLFHHPRQSHNTNNERPGYFPKGYSFSSPHDLMSELCLSSPRGGRASPWPMTWHHLLSLSPHPTRAGMPGPDSHLHCHPQTPPHASLTNAGVPKREAILPVREPNSLGPGVFPESSMSLRVGQRAVCAACSFFQTQTPGCLARVGGCLDDLRCPSF